jgi:hypothetical protein
LTLEQLGKKAAAVSAILVALSLILGLVGRLSWELWLERRVAEVVQHEVAELRLDVARLGQLLTEPDSVRAEARPYLEFGPSPPR